MIFSLAAQSKKELKFDLCIIGAGAAGITLAREFLGQKTSVCLLESGGFNYDKACQNLYRGVTSSPLPRCPKQAYLESSRLRYFGGSTNHWEGWCRPLDELDFEERSWIPNSGWPFKLPELSLHYEKAAKLLQIETFKNYNEVEPNNFLGQHSELFSTRMFHLSPPVRFGLAFKDELEKAANLHVLLDASVVDLESQRSGTALQSVLVRSLGGEARRIKARYFVLACGAVENARILLSANNEKGLGNEHDLVGRFFAEHPQVRAGVLAFTTNAHTKEQLFGNLADQRSPRKQPVLVLSEKAQRELQLRNFSVALQPFVAEESDHVATPIDEQLFFQKLDQWRRNDSDSNAAPLTWLIARTEQSPNPLSRVTLSSERDTLGTRRAQLDWNINAEDGKSYRTAMELLARELGRLAIGRIKIFGNAEKPLNKAIVSSHHMGTTRMHTDPNKGVVDPTCRVYTVPNLFVAGSSVFPASGYANPTLTIIALALRLAAHLKTAEGV